MLMVVICTGTNLHDGGRYRVIHYRAMGHVSQNVKHCSFTADCRYIHRGAHLLEGSSMFQQKDVFNWPGGAVSSLGGLV